MMTASFTLVLRHYELVGLMKSGDDAGKVGLTAEIKEEDHGPNLSHVGDLYSYTVCEHLMGISFLQSSFWFHKQMIVLCCI